MEALLKELIVFGILAVISIAYFFFKGRGKENKAASKEGALDQKKDVFEDYSATVNGVEYSAELSEGVLSIWFDSDKAPENGFEIYAGSSVPKGTSEALAEEIGRAFSLGVERLELGYEDYTYWGELEWGYDTIDRALAARIAESLIKIEGLMDRQDNDK